MAWRMPFPPSRTPASIEFSIKLFVCLQQNSFTCPLRDDWHGQGSGRLEARMGAQLHLAPTRTSRWRSSSSEPTDRSGQSESDGQARSPPGPEARPDQSPDNVTVSGPPPDQRVKNWPPADIRPGHNLANQGGLTGQTTGPDPTGPQFSPCSVPDKARALLKSPGSHPGAGPG